MQIKTINKAVEIRAGKEKVWEVLTRQPYLDEWTSAFMSGSTVKGEFGQDAQILYLDPSGFGVAAKVVVYKPNEELKIAIVAEIVNREPDFNNPNSKKWEGTYDHYHIIEKEGTATLTMDSVFPAEYYNDFAPGWGKMLEKIKELAEK